MHQRTLLKHISEALFDYESKNQCDIDAPKLALHVVRHMINRKCIKYTTMHQSVKFRPTGIDERSAEVMARNLILDNDIETIKDLISFEKYDPEAMESQEKLCGMKPFRDNLEKHYLTQANRQGEVIYTGYLHLKEQG